MDRKENIISGGLEVIGISVGESNISIYWRHPQYGLGEYIIFENFTGYSESMDQGDDKEFLRALFEVLANKLVVS